MCAPAYCETYALESDAIASLRKEAAERKSSSTYIDERQCKFDGNGGVSGRGKAGVAGPGDVLNEFHSGRGLDLARSFSGGNAQLFPTRAAYIYYSNQDYDFFHNDAVHAHITIIVPLSGELQPLLMYPQFGSITQQDVENLNAITDVSSASFQESMQARFGSRSFCTEVDLLGSYAIAIRGRRVPHARYQQTADGSLCTACYAFLVPPPGWLTV